MQLKFGKTGAVVSIFLTLLIGAGIGYFSRRLYIEYNFLPDVVLSLLLLVLGYLFFKPSLLSYFVLTFSKDHKLTMFRPLYRVSLSGRLLSSGYSVNATIDINQLESGSYLIMVKHDQGSEVFRFLKE